MRDFIRRAIVAAITIVIPIVGATTAEAQVTAADATPFIGDWTVNVEGDAPTTFRINITNQDGQVAVAITGSEGGNFTGRDIRKDGENLLFNYTTSIQGTDIPASVTLTPSGESLTGTIVLADGMFSAPLRATKRTS